MTFFQSFDLILGKIIVLFVSSLGAVVVVTVVDWRGMTLIMVMMFSIISAMIDA